ncbi:hypothetical protein QW131_03850 [Roseibium salinum]|nr:hypothetical protein [Roseibium salinum]
MAEAKDNLIRSFALRLRDRKLFKCVDIRARISHEFDPESTGDIEKKSKKIETCCAKSKRKKLTEWNQRESGEIHRILVDEAERSPYKDGAGSIGPTERINVRTDGGKLVDLKQRSRVVANLDEFKLFPCVS